MSARDEVHRALKEVVEPYLRSEGFTGKGQTWRRTVELGDVAIVSVQASKWSTPQMYECILNLAVVPAPWWDWQRSELDRARQQGFLVTGASTLPHEGHGLYRGRLHAGNPSGNEQWWKIHDATEARLAAENMVAQLKTRGVPLLVRLLDRKAMVDVLKANEPLPFGSVWGRTEVDHLRRLAIVLSDSGPSDELEAVIADFEAAADTSPRISPDLKLKVTTWVRHRGGVMAPPEL